MKKKRVRSENENLKMKEKKMTKWIPILKNSYCDLTVFTRTSEIPTPRNLFFSDCNVAVGTRGEKFTGGCGERVGGRGWNKILFLLPHTQKKIREHYLEFSYKLLYTLFWSGLL